MEGEMRKAIRILWAYRRRIQFLKESAKYVGAHGLTKNLELSIKTASQAIKLLINGVREEENR